MHADELARRVGARRMGDHWIARCPAHDDRRPSLDFRDGDLGVVVYCRSRGCHLDAICGAWGIRPAELFYDRHAGPIAQAKLRDKPPGQPRWWRDPRLAALWYGLQAEVHHLDHLARQVRAQGAVAADPEVGWAFLAMAAALETEAERVACCVAPEDLVHAMRST